MKSMKHYREREVKWLSIVNKMDAGSVKKDAKLKKLVRSGIPTSVRSRVWQFLAGSTTDYQKRGSFQHLASQPATPIYNVIDRDLPRCYPDHTLFRDENSQGQQDLGMILKAYAHYNPQLEYCQGMGRLAGCMLMHMPTEVTQRRKNSVMGETNSFFICSFPCTRTPFGCWYAQSIDTWTATSHPIYLSSGLMPISLVSSSKITNLNWLNISKPMMSLPSCISPSGSWLPSPWPCPGNQSYVYGMCFTLKVLKTKQRSGIETKHTAIQVSRCSIGSAWPFYRSAKVWRFLCILSCLTHSLPLDHLLQSCPTNSEILAFLLHIPHDYLTADVLLDTAFHIKLSKTDIGRYAKKATLNGSEAMGLPFEHGLKNLRLGGSTTVGNSLKDRIKKKSSSMNLKEIQSPSSPSSAPPMPVSSV